MKSRVLHLFTRTPLHVGAGSSVGAIDQPVIRERHTGFPVVPGSSIKGVLRDHFRRAEGTSEEEADRIFGHEDAMEAGTIAFSEARLLAFPVRSAKGSFALATSQLALSRFARDSGLGEITVPDAPPPMQCLAGGKLVLESDKDRGVMLEEYKFSVTGEFPADWEEKLSGLLHDEVLKEARGRFVMLSDTDLSHFATSACQVNQHVRISFETGTAEDRGLFNEEAVPSETLFYSTLTVMPRGSEDNALFKSLEDETLIQFGGSGTTGLGFTTVRLG